MSQANSVANVLPMTVQRIRDAAERPQSAFQPVFESCEQHGQYQANVLDDRGAERWLANCPVCRRERSVYSALQGARIPPRFLHASFANYQVKLPGQKVALDACRNYVEAFADNAAAGRCLLLTGTPGTGKSHLSAAVGNALVQAGRTVLFATVSQVMDEVAATWRRQTEHTEREIVNSFASADLLILDDVGVQNGSQQEQVVLYRIIDARYSVGRPTMVTSNLTIDQTRVALGERAFDRLQENKGVVIVCNWPSYRR